jgi:hypothetical protein
MPTRSRAISAAVMLLAAIIAAKHDASGNVLKIGCSSGPRRANRTARLPH